MNLKSNITPTWCPGCNNYLLLAAIEQAANNLNLPQKNLVLVFDIGCIGNMADFFATYGIHSLHGRCLPTALGVKLANPNLTVIAIGGDGGVYGEGLNHLIATARSNYAITTIVSNNNLYSLTTGQASPTSPRYSKTKSTPLGTVGLPLDPIALVHTVNPEVFAKSVDGSQLPLLVKTITAAIQHPGFSLVDVHQLCVTFGKQLNS